MPTAIYKAIFVCRQHTYYESGRETCVLTEKRSLLGQQDFVPIQASLDISNPTHLDITPGQEVEVRLKTKPM